jgi:hypothetical protein
MSVAVGEWFANLWLLAFIKTRMLSIFLPIGLFLRCYGLDRPADVLISVAIGFFFVYPFMLNINALAMQQYLQSEFGANIFHSAATGLDYPAERLDECVNAQPASGVFAGAGGCFWQLQIKGPLKYMASVFKSNTGASIVVLGLAQFFTGSIVGSAVISFLIFFILSLLKAVTFYVIVVSVLMPLFNLFITLTVIKELAHFMGTSIDLGAFERLL